VTVKRLEHVGVVVDDLPAAIEFFLELGLGRGGEGRVGGEWVDRIVGLTGVDAEFAMLQTPDGREQLELVRFHSPAAVPGDAAAPANALGLRHLAFLVEEIDELLPRLRARGAEPIGELVRYQDIYRLCYVRGPAGIIVELAERID
jgi:catechol 2,3-dioxygenase-like lactoylglutathione lyase family enzyme